MQLSRRRFALSSAAFLTGLTPPARAVSPRPRLLLWFVSTQFRADYLERFGPQLGAGGFRRLMDEGAYFPDCRMNASTFSSSAVASLATGAYPDTHGVVADRWFDTASRRIVQAAPELSEATTLAEEVAFAGPGNRVYILGGADSGAGLLAARASSAAGQQRIYDPLAPVDVASDHPAWVKDFLGAHAAEKFKGAKWQTLQAEASAPALRILKDDPERPADFEALYRASPFAQQTQFEFLRTLLAEDKLGAREDLDLVIVVLDAMSRLGNEVGADSPLMREMVLRLDRELESTLDAAKNVAGAGNFAVAFTGAHGAPREMGPEYIVDGTAVAQSIDDELSAAYDLGSLHNRYVDRYVYPFAYLRHEQLRRYGVDVADARRAAGRAALKVPGVAAYCTADGHSSRGKQWLTRFRNSMHAVRSGDIMIAYHPHYVEKFDGSRGVSYGSLYNYDVRVPLILWGPQFQAQTLEGAVESIDVAPTLARALHTSLPSSATGRVLGRAFSPETRTKK